MQPGSVAPTCGGPAHAPTLDLRAATPGNPAADRMTPVGTGVSVAVRSRLTTGVPCSGKPPIELGNPDRLRSGSTFLRAGLISRTRRPIRRPNRLLVGA